jgi:competence protein ComGC
MTLVEVLVVLAIVALLGALLIPSSLLAKQRSRRAGCICHLKQVGLAFRIFSNDHGNQFPWAAPATNGGTIELAESPNVFQHFLAASNELSVPKILTCPTDTRSPARSWPTFGNTNLSYFVSITANETRPQAWLSGDRNISGGVLSNGFMLTLTSNSIVNWTTALHKQCGNVTLADGSAQQIPPTIARELMRLAIP